MSDPTTIETCEFQCLEEGRTARLQLRWSGPEGARTLESVQCDNPKFASLEHWECHWSCWQRIAERARDDT